MARTSVVCVLAAAAPTVGQTLRSDQVLVVANAKAKGSVPLGKYYCMARGIGEDRLLIIRATAAPDTDRRFPAGTVGTPRTTGTYDALRGKFAKLLLSKVSAAGRLTDPANRVVALRQIAGLRLDAFGARGLLKALPTEKIPGVPGADMLRKQIEADAFELGRLT